MLKYRLTLSLPLGFLLLLPCSSFGQAGLNLNNLVFEGVALSEITQTAIATDNIHPSNPKPQNKFDETLLEPSGDFEINRYEQALSNLEESEGPFALSLTENFEALGTLYHAQGNYLDAITAFEDAQHIIRVNNGLFSVKQIPLIEKIIENYTILNDFNKVQDYHEHLYYLQKKSYSADAPEMIAASIAWADWNIQAYYNDPYSQNSDPFAPINGINYSSAERFGTASISGRSPRLLNPQSINNNLAVSSYNNFSSTQMALNPYLKEAERVYKSVLIQFPQTPDTSISEKISLQEKLANITFIISQKMNTFDYIDSSRNIQNYDYAFQRQNSNPLSSRVHKGYVNTKNALEAIILSLQQASEPDFDSLANAQLSLADWHLSFDYNHRASRLYSSAYSTLVEADKSPESITAFLSPQANLFIPTFATHRFSRQSKGINNDENLNYKGHIDVNLMLSRYGDVKRIRIISTSPNTSQRLRRALLYYLRDQKLRPAILAGEMVQKENLTIRYFYTY